MPERCYNCGKEEKITEGVSNIEMIEVDLKEYSVEGEKYMPLCSECGKKLEGGGLKGIEERWKAEKNKAYYSSFATGVSECDECGKEISVGVPYHCVEVHNEKEDNKGEVEVLEAEVLFTYCEDCFKNMEVVMRKK